MTSLPLHDDPADEVGRIMLAHGLVLVARLLGIEDAEAIAMIRSGHSPVDLGRPQHERLRLFINILVRMECRFDHDSQAIRHALCGPLDHLGGRTPTELLAGNLSDLRALRHATDHMRGPKVRWWRVDH